MSKGLVSLGGAVALAVLGMTGWLNAEGARWLFALALVLVIIGVVLLAVGRGRAPSVAPATTTPQAGDGNISVSGSYNTVTVRPSAPASDLAAGRDALSDRLLTGGEILNDVRHTPYPKFYYEFDDAYRPRIMQWHKAAAGDVNTHYGPIRGRYSSSSDLPTFDVFFRRHRSGRVAKLLHEEAIAFLSDRIAELRSLLSESPTSTPGEAPSSDLGRSIVEPSRVPQLKKNEAEWLREQEQWRREHDALTKEGRDLASALRAVDAHALDPDGQRLWEERCEAWLSRAGVPAKAWAWGGAFRPLEHFLTDRRGRRLDAEPIAMFQSAIWAVREAIRLAPALDAALEAVLEATLAFEGEAASS